jgi:hypothetical protein
MLRRVALIRTNVSEELGASFIRVTRIGEIGTTLPVTSNRRTLRRNASWLMLCKIWGFHGCPYEECSLLGYKNPVRTSEETHYVSTTESSRLMLCKIWGFHSGDYEECRLLRYQNQVITSQETHYFSASEPGRLILCDLRFSRRRQWRMPFSVMLRHVALVRTDLFGGSCNLHYHGDNNQWVRNNVSSN